MKIIYLAIFFTSIYSVKSVILNVVPSKTNLEEGDNLTITTVAILLPNETMIALKWFSKYTQNKLIASATSTTDISISADGKTMFGNRISASAYCGSSGLSDICFSLNFNNLQANDSTTLLVKCTYQNVITNAYADINRIVTIDVKVKCGTLNVVPNKTNLKEGDNLTITTVVTLSPNEQFAFIRWFYNQNKLLATATLTEFSISKDANIVFDNRVSVRLSGNDYLINFFNLQANDSITLTVRLTYENINTGVPSSVIQKLTIEVKVKSASLNIAPSKSNLQEGDNLIITTTVRLSPNDQILAIRWFYNQNKLLATASLITEFSISKDANIVFANRVSTGSSGTDYLLNFNNLQVNDSITLTVELTYENIITSAYGYITQNLTIDVKAKYGTLNVVPNKTNLKEGDNLTITTVVTLSPNEQIAFIRWFYNQSKLLATGSSTEFSISKDANIVFDNRVAARLSGTDYLINFINLQANDSITVTVRVTFENINSGATFNANQSLTIDVKADPIILRFTEVLFVKERNKLFVESIIYGKPPPTTNIVYADQTYNAYNYSDLSNNAYKYVYSLNGFTAANCGSTLLLNVFGNGITINRSAIVYVLFTPGLVILSSPVMVFVQSEKLLIHLNWYPVSSGTCHVTYSIEFLNNKNEIVDQFYGIITTSFSTFYNANANIFRIYAVYNGTLGFALNQTIPPPHSTTTTVTTTSQTTISNSKPATTAKTELKGFITVKISTVVGIAVGVIVFFFGLLVGSYLLCYHRRKKRKNKKSKVVNKDLGVSSYQEFVHLADSNSSYQKLDDVKTGANKDNGLSCYQELVHLSEGNARYQNLDAVNINGKNTNMPDIGNQNYAVSESYYNYANLKVC